MPLNNPHKRLFVGSLPYSYTQDQVLELFTPFGEIVDCQIVFDQRANSRGIAYIEYKELDSAIKAQSELHGFALEERTIIVDFAKPDPFQTEEGKLRHQMAQEKHFARQQTLEKQKEIQRKESYERQKLIDKKEKEIKDAIPILKGEGFSHPRYKSKYAGKPGHLRETLFKQRYFGSKQGKKFAKKTKKKKA